MFTLSLWCQSLQPVALPSQPCMVSGAPAPQLTPGLPEAPLSLLLNPLRPPHSSLLALFPPPLLHRFHPLLAS